jgi:pyruvate dehydrogenase E2 component (dihydrolipoamide acetyltransferase)
MPEVQLRGGDVDGLAVHYVAEGDGEPTVILIHGLGGFGESWRHNLPALGRGAQVFALDLPGYGRSAKPPGPYDLGFLARVVHGFMATMGIGQASLVGHSLGGAVAVTCALTRPSRIERLCLIGSLVPGLPYQPSWVFRTLARRGLGELLGLLGHARLYKAAVARCFYRPVPGEVDFLVDFAYEARTGPEARAAFLATLRHVGQDLRDRAEAYRRAIATLDVPVLLIHGQEDAVVSPSHVASATEIFPRATVRWVEACGHFPHIERAGDVNGWMARFLSARPAAL